MKPLNWTSWLHNVHSTLSRFIKAFSSGWCTGQAAQHQLLSLYTQLCWKSFFFFFILKCRCPKGSHGFAVWKSPGEIWARVGSLLRCQKNSKASILLDTGKCVTFSCSKSHFNFVPAMHKYDMCTKRLTHSRPENEETFLPGMKKILANEEILLL